MRPAIAALALAALVSACSPPTAGQVGGSRAAKPAAGDQASGNAYGQMEKLFGREKFTIVLEYRSRFVGTHTVYVRDWGRLRALVDIQRRVGDPEEYTYDRYQVCRRDKCFHKEGTDGEIETSANDIGYSLILEKLIANPGAYDAVHAFYPARLERSGKRDTIAGQDCEYWTNSSGRMNVGRCLTSWGAMLSWGNADQSEETFRAVEVRLDDGGPDEAFNWAPEK
jgi:hypothetical protein